MFHFSKDVIEYVPYHDADDCCLNLNQLFVFIASKSGTLNCMLSILKYSTFNMWNKRTIVRQIRVEPSNILIEMHSTVYFIRFEVVITTGPKLTYTKSSWPFISLYGVVTVLMNCRLLARHISKSWFIKGSRAIRWGIRHP